jgi:purine-nucleoside phosphorylase
MLYAKNKIKRGAVPFLGPSAVLGSDTASAEEMRCTDALNFLRRAWTRVPRAAIILGTGLGQLAAQIQPDVIIEYGDVPHFPRATALGHHGRFVCGTLGQTPVIALDGRFHFYEGYCAEEIVLPISVVQKLGAELLIVSNASGGLNPQYQSGDLMALADHINLMGHRSALLCRNGMMPSRSGQPNPYDSRLIDLAQEIARREDFSCHRGTYVAVLGPNYETRAEYRALRRIGGDVVGMSTVPEVLAAMRCGLRVLALSIVTNVARPDAPTTTEPQHVIDIASRAEPKLRHIVDGVLSTLFRDSHDRFDCARPEKG